jgi:glutamate racemase
MLKQTKMRQLEVNSLVFECTHFVYLKSLNPDYSKNSCYKKADTVNFDGSISEVVI